MPMKHYINGRLVAGHGREFRVLNPGTEETAGTFRCADRAQAQEALAAARDAFPGWSALSLAERETWILKLAAAIEAEEPKIVELMMAETGKPKKTAGELGALLESLRFFIEEAKRIDQAVIPDRNGKFRSYIVRQPLGIVVGYLAWNYPVANVGFKLGPALAAGCTCILRPSSRAPLSTLYLGEIAVRIGFPKGVFNLIAGSSADLAPVLNESTDVRLITCIGSSATGREIIRSSTTSIKHYSMELGGNAPAIVLADADLEKAAQQIVAWKFSNTGQSCVAPNRIFVHASVHDDFLRRVLAHTARVKVGCGPELDADMGPLISREDRDRMTGLVQDAVKRGGKVVAGGGIPKDRPKGYYFEPTVIDAATDDMLVCAKEIFGPIMPVLTFTAIDEVIRRANHTEHGLASYIFGRSLGDVYTIAESLEAGSVCINEPHFAINLPHGGFKESGIGKDRSVYSLEEYYSMKRISLTF